MGSKPAEQQEQVAKAKQSSRILDILASLRGEDPKALMAGLDAEQDPDVSPDPQPMLDENGEPLDPDAEPLAPGPALNSISDSARSRVAGFRNRAGAYRGTSPTTRR